MTYNADLIMAMKYISAHLGAVRNSFTSLKITLNNLYIFLTEIVFCDSTRIQCINYFVTQQAFNILRYIALIRQPIKK